MLPILARFVVFCFLAAIVVVVIWGVDQLGFDHPLFLGLGLAMGIPGVVAGVASWSDVISRYLATERFRLKRPAVRFSIVLGMLFPVTLLYVMPSDDLSEQHMCAALIGIIVGFVFLWAIQARVSSILVGQLKCSLEMETTITECLNNIVKAEDLGGKHIAYQDMLTRLCSLALECASKTTRLGAIKPSDCVATILMANPETQRFDLCGSSGGTAGYISHLEGENSPPFLDLTAFVAHYNKFCSKANNLKRFGYVSRKARFKLLEDFRKDLGKYSSTAGWVQDIDRNLYFQDAYDRCVTTSFSFIDDLLPEQKNLNKFQQLVAIPIRFLDRRVGVLLLYSTERSWFNEGDPIFRFIGEIVGRAVYIGFETRLLPPGSVPYDGNWLMGLPHVFSDNPKRAHARKVLNSISYRFDMPIILNPT